MSRRHIAYNQQIELVNKLEENGQIKCIRPLRPIEVGRIEKDTDKLERLYEEGFTIGEEFIKNNTKLF